jgi:hypothetical protein
MALCACSGPASDGAVAGDDALASGSTSSLQAIARRVQWADKGELNSSVGTDGTLTANDIDRDGSAGFHGFTTSWTDDAIPSYDVVADFTPVLVVKVLDCVACTNVVVGKKNSTTGKYEIKQARPKDGTSDGFILGDPAMSHHQVFVTSVENLQASSDPTKANKSVTNGTYNIQSNNLE